MTRDETQRRRFRPIVFAAWPLMLQLAAAQAWAQVRTDGSLGQAARSLAGPNYAITESLGRRAGSNLFHSFETFRIGSGEAALFSTTTPTVANIFARVTGGDISSIDGTIRLQAVAGAPSLFLINPAGITFGPGASMDVPGAFYATTADYLKFPDGAFHADPAKASTFSSAPPEAFGFLGASRAGVTLAGAFLYNGDSPLRLVAGDIVLTDTGTVENRAGDVTAVAVGRQATEIPLAGAGSGPLHGEIRIGPGSYLGTYSEGEVKLGDVRVEAGRIEATGQPDWFTGIVSRTVGGAAGGSLFVRSDESLVLGPRTRIQADAYGAGDAGAITIRAGQFHSTGHAKAFDSGVLSIHDAGGRSGDVSVKVTGALTLEDQTTISSISNGGDSGAVQVSANTIDVSGLFTDIVSSAGGASGAVAVQAARSLSLSNFGEMRSSAFGSRPAGSISVSAPSITLDGGEVRTQGQAGGGAISVQAEDALRLANSGHIEAATGGAVQIGARRVTLDNSIIESFFFGDEGTSGALKVNATELLHLAGNSSIGSRNIGGGNGGAVSVTAGRLDLDGSHVSSSASNGRAGDVRVAVAGAALLSDSYIASTNGVGDRSSTGNVTVSARELVLNRSTIDSTNFFSSGRSGDISVTVDDRLSILNDGLGYLAGIHSSHYGRGERAGAAGGIVVRTGSLWIENTAPTRSSAGLGTSTVDGAAGRMDVEVRGEARLRGAYVSSTSSGAGDGGALRWRVGDALVLEDSAITSSSFGDGRAGDIGIEARAIRLAASAGANELGLPFYSRISSDGDGTGGGGSITLRAAQAFDLIGGSSVSTDTGGAGPAGRVQIEAGSLSMAARGAYSRISSGTSASGNAGEVVLKVAGAVELREGAQVTTTTFGDGRAGVVSIEAGRLLVDGGPGDSNSTISSRGGLNEGARGDAGSIHLQVEGTLEVRNGGEITSSAGRGAAGSIDIQAGQIEVTGFSPDGAVPSRIAARAFPSSSGQAGNLALSARDLIEVKDGAEITVQNDASTATQGSATAARQGVLRLTAPRIVLQGGTVSAASSGAFAASDIVIDAGQLLLVDRGRITTSATGSAGDGGNIKVDAPVLALNSGYVQANATARLANGGDIDLSVAGLLASHASLRVGGDTPLPFDPAAPGLNVIQAAAPTGVSGSISVASPRIDLAGSLVLLSTRAIPAQRLGRSPCQGSGSSLALAGQGGLPPSARSPAGSYALVQPASLDVARLSADIVANGAGCRRR